MAKVCRSSKNWMLASKVFLISGGVLSVAVILKLLVPVILELAVSDVPVIWSCLLSWLRPPYLYVVINCIIITIAASSKFQKKVDVQPETVVPVADNIPVDVRPDFAVSTGYESVMLKNPVVEPPEFTYKDTNVMKNPVETTGHDYEVLDSLVLYGQNEARVLEVNKDITASVVDDEDDFVISRSDWALQRSESMDIPPEYLSSTEKPPISTRFGHRKTVKASPEGGKALGVARSKRQDTLENTWKMITDGRAMPLTRHLKKSDTWETHNRHVDPTDSDAQKMQKSETFNDRSINPSPSLTPSPGSGKLRKEPSLGQDELNRRVEAFIKKFNEEMRLQRQESLNQYNEMVNRGAY